MQNDYNVLANIVNYVKKYNVKGTALLDEINVQEVDEEHIKTVFKTKGKSINGLLGWYMVLDVDGVNTYFSTEYEALEYRRSLINRVVKSLFD